MRKLISKRSKLYAILLGCLITIQASGLIAFAENTIRPADDFVVSDRDYINLPSEWKGNASGDGILQTNIYPGSEPLVKRVNNTNVLVWLADDASRNSVNRTQLMYSVQLVASGTWTSPQPVDNDNTADFYPNIASDGNDVFVTWQNINKEFGEAEATLEKLAEASEIKVSKFNKAANSFDTPVRLTTNNVLDQTPVAAVSGGKAYVSWVSNDAKDLFGTKGNNSIMYSCFDGTTWQQAKKLADCAGIPISITSTGLGGKLYLSYSLDVDKKLETVVDREIYYIIADASTQSGQKQLTKNNVIDSKPEIVTRNNKASVFWYQDKRIKYVEDITAPVIKDFLPEPIDGYNDNYKIVFDKDNICLMWAKQVNGSIEVFGAFYDTEIKEMTNIVKLTDTKQMIVSFDAIYDQSGELYLVCNKAEKIEKTLDKNKYYEQGLSDLYTTKISWNTNGSADIASTKYNESDFCPGKPLPISFDFKNIGNKAIKKLTIEAYEGNPFNGGKKLDQSKTIETYIKAGSFKNISTSFTPKEARKYNLYLKVLVNDNDDIDMTDNIIYADMGYCDIMIEKLTVMGNEDSKTLVVTIKNTSVIPAKDVKLFGREDSESGKIITEKGLFTVNAGGKQQILCSINTKDIKFDKDGVKIIHILTTTSSEERYTSNNNTSFLLSKRLPSNGNDNGGDPNGNQNGNGDTGVPGGIIVIPGDDKPSTNKSNNAKLSTLNIDKGTLSPAFDKNTGLYDLTLGSDIKDIIIDATTEDKKALVIIDGVVKSNSVTNYHIKVPSEKTRLEISVKAENGEVKTYIIKIKRTVVKDDGEKPSTDARELTDINSHWAKDYILSLVKVGIMAGYPDKTFKPDNKISRAEAAVVLVKIFNKNPDNASKLAFKDEGKIPSWAYGYINTAVQMGWIKGYTDNTFKASNYITRQEFTAMFIRAMGYNEINIDKTSFADDAKIALWAKGYVGKAAELKLIGGYHDKTFRPSGNITRAEVCVIAQKYIDTLK